MATIKNQIVNALVMALEEIHHPGAARNEGVDITVLIEDALHAVREMPTREPPFETLEAAQAEIDQWKRDDSRKAKQNTPERQ